MVVELKVIVEKNFMIHLIPMRHFYGLQFLNKSVKVVFNISPVVSVSRRNVFLQLFNNPDKTCKKKLF